MHRSVVTRAVVLVAALVAAMAPSALALTHGEAHHHEAEHAHDAVVAAGSLATEQIQLAPVPSHHEPHGHPRVDAATKPNLVVSSAPQGQLVVAPPFVPADGSPVVLRDGATRADAQTVPRPPDPRGTPLRSPRPPPLG